MNSFWITGGKEIIQLWLEWHEEQQVIQVTVKGMILDP